MFELCRVCRVSRWMSWCLHVRHTYRGFRAVVRPLLNTWEALPEQAILKLPDANSVAEERSPFLDAQFEEVQSIETVQNLRQTTAIVLQ